MGRFVAAGAFIRLSVAVPIKPSDQLDGTANYCSYQLNILSTVCRLFTN